MNTAKESNLKSIVVISIVSILLFGIFYYLITDVSNSSSSELKSQTTQSQEQPETKNYVAKAETPTQVEFADKPAEPKVETTPAKVEGDVKGDETENSKPPEAASVFKALSTQKVEPENDKQPAAVLGGSDQQIPESTVPVTGSETIFAAFVVSSLVMFTGIYLLLTKPKNAALAKFEKRIIRELD